MRTFRIPETWNQIAEPPKDNLTFAPPDTPHLRLWVSSLTAPADAEAGQKPADIETLAARLVKKLPVNEDGSLQYEVRRLDANRAVISYELHLDAIAPQYIWWLIERQGNTLCCSLFTLSVHADQFRSDETRRLVAVLGQEVAAATHGPAPQAPQAGAAWTVGRESPTPTSGCSVPWSRRCTASAWTPSWGAAPRGRPASRGSRRSKR